MKKKLEAELISIAHRILKLRNKSELIQLHQETQKLYEKLSVLLFVEENFSALQPTIGKKEAFETLESAFDNNKVENKAVANETQENEPVSSEAGSKNVKKEVAEPAAEEENGESTEESKHEESVSEVGSESENAIADTEAPEENEPVVSDDTDEDVVESLSEESETESAPQAENSDAEPDSDSESNNETEPDNEEEIPKHDESPDSESESVIEEGIDFIAPETEAEIEKVPDATPSQPEDTFKPAFEWGFEPKVEFAKEEEPAKKESGQIAFEDLLGSGYVDPVFVKPEENTPRTIENIPGIPKFPDFRKENSEIADKTVSLNDRLSKGITVGLNDRIAFVKNLFGNSNEEYNRVLSQLITFNTFEEAQEFIDNMVKPDYNNWEGKDEYATRFMEVVEKKFT